MNSVKREKIGGCPYYYAYPSTDTFLFPELWGYYSDCTDIELPYLINPVLPISTSNYDENEPGIPYMGDDCFPPDPDDNQLRFTSDSPAENFFKIQDESGVWWYLTVVPKAGPYDAGDGVPYSNDDKKAKYEMMDNLWESWRHSNDPYLQYWGYWPDSDPLPPHPAKNLPPHDTVAP